MNELQRIRRVGRRPGSQSALRQANQRRVVEALRDSGPATQAELARSTGLSTATVSNIVRLLAEEGQVQISPTTSSGRRASSVRLVGGDTVGVGVDFGRRHVRVALARSDYRVLVERATALPLGYPAEEGLQHAARLLDALLQEAELSRSEIAAVGVGIPGPIDRRTDTVVQGSILPDWVGIGRDDVERVLGLPVIIDNDANLGALAEVTWGPHSGVSNLMFVKIGSGIGSGLILNGSLYHGHVGITGEIGHSSLSDLGLVCRCGNRGCLETIVSTSIIIELLSRGQPRLLTTAEVVAQALAGDKATLRVLDDVGSALGRALASSLNLINPEVLVVGGSLAGLGDLLLDPIRRGLLRHAIPAVGDTTVVAMSSLGERAEALGGVALALRSLASPV